jgi:ABC-type sugar transport system substrate-binding protein
MKLFLRATAVAVAVVGALGISAATADAQPRGCAVLALNSDRYAWQMQSALDQGDMDWWNHAYDMWEDTEAALDALGCGA